ncbi:MAG: CBS domain-containing protein [Parafilimonas sp.]
MSKVKDILSRKGRSIASIEPNAAVIDALRMMAAKNIGSVVVMEGEKFLGIMTERDYSRKVILKGRSSTDTAVSEIMTSELPSVSENDSVEYCMQLMSSKNLRYLPVMEKDKLTGIISINDVVTETIIIQEETISHLHSYIQS